MKAEPGELTLTFTPWSQWVREVAASKVALVTTAGAYLKHGLHEPFDLGREGGDPTFREFPSVVDLADVALAGEEQGRSAQDRSGGEGQPRNEVQPGGDGATVAAENDQAGGDEQEQADAEARAQVNRVFPLDRLRAMAAAGTIDAVAPFAYSFSRALSDPLPLLADFGPAVAYRIRRMGADVALVVAAGDSGLPTAAIVARLIELAGIPSVVLAADAAALRTAGVPRGVAMDPEAWVPRLPEALEAAWPLDAPGVVAL
ncbi:hypothetical protein [Symbiobacterium terraclitae]|uniref:hypothetical protein n=1 Tax=Symbiobacterium terraclitae TaxID=557451 RepID=UPI0035B52B2F